MRMPASPEAVSSSAWRRGRGRQRAGQQLDPGGVGVPAEHPAAGQVTEHPR